MAVKIRLKRFGRKKRPCYRIVVADSRTARNGKVIEEVGTYTPLDKDNLCECKAERISYWIAQGAQLTDTVHRLLSKKGIVKAQEKKSSNLGVSKKEKKEN